MFKAGWSVDLDDNPNAHGDTESTLVEKRRMGEKIFVSITEQSKEWARLQYLTDATIDDFLDDFVRPWKSRGGALEKVESP